MSTEQERLEKAKQKLMNMNRKVLHAQNISKKRTPKKPELEPMSPAPPPRQKNASSNTYLFELTESMITDGFTEEEVTQYVKRVELDAKCTDLELDQHEIMVNAEIKKINRAIRRIKDPKPISAREPAAESPRSEKSEKEVEPKESENQQPGYAELQKVRNGQNHGEKQVKQEKPLSPVTRKVAASPTPKKSKLPARRKTNEPDTPSAGIQATAAGAKFFADLMNDDDDPPF